MVTRLTSQSSTDDKNAALHSIQEHMNLCSHNLQKLRSQLDEDFVPSAYGKTASLEAPPAERVPKPSGFPADTGSTPTSETPPGGRCSKSGGRLQNVSDFSATEGVQSSNSKTLNGCGDATPDDVNAELKKPEKVVAVRDADSNLLYSSRHVYAPIAELLGGKTYLNPPEPNELEAALEAVALERMNSGGSVEATAATSQNLTALEPAADWSSAKPYPPVVEHHVGGKAPLPPTEKVSGGAGRRSAARAATRAGAPPPSTSGTATPARVRDSARTTPQAKRKAQPVEVPVQSLGRSSPLRQNSSNVPRGSTSSAAPSLCGSTRSVHSCSSAASSLRPSAASTTAGTATPSTPTVTRRGCSSAGSSHVAGPGTGGARSGASRGETSARSDASSRLVRMVSSPPCVSPSATPRIVRSYSSSACGLATPAAPAQRGVSRPQSPPRAQTPLRVRAQSPVVRRSPRRSQVLSPGRAAIAGDAARSGETPKRAHSPLSGQSPRVTRRHLVSSSPLPSPEQRTRVFPAPSSPPQSRPASRAASPMPGARPASPMPGARPASPMPSAQPASPMPGARPTSPMPGARPASPIPGARWCYSLGDTRPTSRPTSPMPGARWNSTSGSSSPPLPASPHQMPGPGLHVPHGTCPGPANDPHFLRQAFGGGMEHATSMPSLGSASGFAPLMGSRGLPPAPIPLKSQNLWEVEDPTNARWPSPSSAAPPPPPPPQPMPWGPLSGPLSPPLTATGVIAQDHALIGPFQPWAPLRGGGLGGWPGPCGNMTPPPGHGWPPSPGAAGSGAAGLVHYDPGASSQSSGHPGAHERGGQRARKLSEEARSKSSSKSREPSWAPVVETPWAPVVRVGESMVCSSSAGGIERSELNGDSLPSTSPNLRAHHSNLQESSSHALDVDFTSQCSPELLAQKRQRGSETPRGGFLYPQSAAQSFDDPEPTWLRPPFGVQHQVR